MRVGGVMNRRGTSVFVPLLAAMALFYPVAIRRRVSEPASPFSRPATANTGSKLPGNTPNKKEEWSRGGNAVRRFFKVPIDKDDKYLWDKDKKADVLEGATLNFLIVTIPDPIDSGLLCSAETSYSIRQHTFPADIHDANRPRCPQL